MPTSINFKAQLDSKDFDAQLQVLQAKVEKMRSISQTATSFAHGQGLSSESMKGMQSASAKIDKQSVQFIKDQQKAQKDLLKDIHEQEKAMKSITDEIKNGNKSLEDRAKLQDKLNRTQEQHTKNQEMMKERSVAISKTQDIRSSHKAEQDRMIRERGLGGMIKDRGLRRGAMDWMGAGGVGGALKGGIGALGGLKNIISGLRAVTNTVGEVYGYQARMPLQVERARATQAQVGAKAFQALFEGGEEEALFAPQRMQAMKDSRTFEQKKRKEDSWKQWFGWIHDDRYRARMFDEDRYEEILQGDVAERQQQTYESLKAQDPRLQYTQRFLPQRMQQFGGVRRQLMLSDKDLFGTGGLIGQNLSRGYTTDEQAQAMQGILQAGGGTAAGRGLAGDAAMMARMGQANAAQVLGTFGRGLETPAESKDAYRRTLAEGVKAGFDSSNAAQELSIFAQTTADIAMKMGLSESGTGRISDIMGGAIGDTKTVRGIQNAAGALEMIDAMTGEEGGMSGALKANFIKNNQALSGLSNKNLASVLQMGYGDLDPESDRMASIYAQLKGTGGFQQAFDAAGGGDDKAGKQFLVKQLEKMQQFGVSRLQPTADVIAESKRTVAAERARMEEGGLSPDEMEASQERIRVARGDVIGALRREGALKGKVTPEKETKMVEMIMNMGRMPDKDELTGMLGGFKPVSEFEVARAEGTAEKEMKQQEIFADNLSTLTENARNHGQVLVELDKQMQGLDINAGKASAKLRDLAPAAQKIIDIAMGAISGASQNEFSGVLAPDAPTDAPEKP